MEKVRTKALADMCKVGDNFGSYFPEGGGGREGGWLIRLPGKTGGRRKLCKLTIKREFSKILPTL